MKVTKLLSRAARAALAAAWLIVWHLGPTLRAAAETDEERAAAFSAQIQASMLALEDGDRDAPRDRWDPQYVADTVGIDAGDLFAWLRGSVAWMPYRGALRGAEGVLMDRVGNSLDQALLLAALFGAAGHDVRLARAELPAATVEATLARLGAARQATGGTAEGATEAAETVDEVLVTADLYGIDQASVAEVLASTAGEAGSVAGAMASRIEDQAARLSGIVGPLDDAAIAADIAAAARASLADHFWVQALLDGAWVDFDVLAPDGQGALAPAAETFDAAAIPPELEQRVIVRVVTEQLKDGALSERVILEQPVRPRDLLGATLGFRHFPMAWPDSWPRVTPDDIQVKLRAALYAQTEWLPVLVAGDEVMGTLGVHDTGEIDPDPQPVNPFMQMTVVMTGLVSKATDVLASGADPDALVEKDASLDEPRPPRPEGELVAERLEFELQVPGLEPRIHRRDLFDLVGPAARASGDLSGFTMSGQKALDRSMAMLAESEFQILPSRMAPEFLTHLGAQNAIGNRPVLDELARDPFGKVPSNFMELFSKLNGMPAALLSHASLRFAINPWGDWVYMDRPSILAQHTRLSRAGGGDFVARVGLDIVENGIGVDPLAAGMAAALRMSQGIADTNAEALALEKVGMVTANAAGAFAAVEPGGRDWIALRGGEEAVVALLGPMIGFDADAGARIAAELAGGKVVVLPAELAPGGPFPGWWRIDPASGATLGIGATGHGQAMVEYALIIVIETMMAAAQCALQASVDRFMQRTLAEKAKGADSGKATAAGASAGYAEALKTLGDAEQRNRCIASGMFAGFKTLLLGFAMHAVKTSGSKGHDGSKPPPSWERNSVKNQSASAGGAPGSPRAPAPGPKPPAPGPQAPQTPRAGNPPQPPQPPRAGNPPPQPQPPRPPQPTADQGRPPGPPQARVEGPYQSDPAGLKQLRENESQAKGAIGPVERFEQADQQSRKTYDWALGEKKSPQEARQWSEEAWWDTYKNYHNAPARPAAPDPALAPTQSPLSMTMPAPAGGGGSSRGFAPPGAGGAKTAGLAGLTGALGSVTDRP